MIDEKATLREIDEHWSLAEVLDCNEALDVATDVAAARQRAGRAAQPPPPPPPKQGGARAKGTRPRPPRRTR